MIKLSGISALLGYMLAFLLTACERRELTYYEVAEITITVDWSQSGLENESDYGATALFYPKTGEAPQIVLMGNRNHSTMRLREGHYSVVLFNRSFNDFAAIAFRGVESLNTLEAYVKHVENRSSSETIVSSPEKLASAVVEDFEVTKAMLGNYIAEQLQNKDCMQDGCSLSLTPKELTRTVKVKINVEGLGNVKTASCRLGGVPVSVFLSNGQKSREVVMQEFGISNPVFDEGSTTTGTLSGEINVFGFDFDANTSHYMEMNTLLVDGKTNIKHTFNDVDISQKTDETGTVVLHIEATTPEPLPDVEPEKGPDSGFNADVDGWGKEEHTELPL